MRRIPRAITSLGVALAVAAAALAQSPAPKPDDPKAASSKTTSLARFIPRDKLIYYGEFQGTAAHSAAWSNTSASKILNDTPAGAMLEDLAVQLMNVPFNKAPEIARKPTPPEVMAALKHAAGAGMVFAVNIKAGAPGGAVKTMVFPGAMRDDASKKTFAAVIKGLIPPGGKTTTLDKPGNRKVISALRPDGGVAVSFWVEGKLDLIITDDPDLVIAALDGKSPNAADHPARLALATGEDGEEPLAFGWLDNSDVPGESPLREPFGPKVDTSSIKRITYRLALRGANLAHELTLVAPSPRPAALALLDGAKFDLKTLPSLPEGVAEFSALAIDPSKFYGQILALAKATNPGSEASFAKVEASVKAKTKMRLREDILARLGPRMLAYTSPSKAAKAGPQPGGLLSAIQGGGFQVPKGAILIEIKDPKAVGTMLDGLAIAANKEIRAQMAALAPDPAKNAPGQTAAKAPTPEFRPGATNPKTFNLNLPGALGAMTNLRLTIVVGKKYLVIATMPDAAKEALAAEAKPAGKAPSGDVAKAIEGLPSSMVLLEVSDPKDTLPEGLVNLPATLTAAFAPAATPPAAAAAPPGQPAAGPPGNRGRGRPAMPTAAAAGAVPSAGLGGEGAKPAAPDNAAAKAAGGGPTFQVDPARVPSADAIRALIGPSATAVVADEQGIRLVIRHSFPDLGMLASLPATIKGMTGSMQALGSAGVPKIPAPNGAPRGNMPRNGVPPAGGAGKPPGAIPID